MKLIYAGLVLATFILGIALGKYVWVDTHNPEPRKLEFNEFEEIRASGYKFINPLLECELPQNSVQLTGLNFLQIKVAQYIESQKNTGNITDASVYFRDLNNGPWFGVNEHAPFSPASLLKLPVMISYYKQAESNPQILEKEIKNDKITNLLNQSIEPKKKLKPQQIYTVNELIERMIVYSDNAALVLLEENIDRKLIDQVTIELGVETASENTPEDFMSVKGYAGLFRILFNASYLSREYSEKLLKFSHDRNLKMGY